MGKRKPPLPRRTWQIKPVTRVKGNAKAYDRNKAEQTMRKEGV